jgi:tetratricopeptide (TPR) repeat protein
MSLPLGLWPGSFLAQGTPLDQAILCYQQMLRRYPGDVRAYYRLGDAYIQKARESRDVTHFNLAEQALQKALDIAPHHSGALRHLAYVLHSRHEFQEAAIRVAKAIQLDPTDSHAYGILGDAYQDVGAYEQAQEAYQRMIQTQRDL